MRVHSSKPQRTAQVPLWDRKRLLSFHLFSVLFFLPTWKRQRPMENRKAKPQKDLTTLESATVSSSLGTQTVSNLQILSFWPLERGKMTPPCTSQVHQYSLDLKKLWSFLDYKMHSVWIKWIYVTKINCYNSLENVWQTWSSFLLPMWSNWRSGLKSTVSLWLSEPRSKFIKSGGLLGEFELSLSLNINNSCIQERRERQKYKRDREEKEEKKKKHNDKQTEMTL